MNGGAAWGLSLGACALATFADVGVTLVRGPHLISSIVAIAAFGGAGFFVGRKTLLRSRAWFGPLAAGAALHAALTVAWFVALVHTDAAVGFLPALFNGAIAVASGVSGFAGGERRRR